MTTQRQLYRLHILLINDTATPTINSTLFLLNFINLLMEFQLKHMHSQQYTIPDVPQNTKLSEGCGLFRANGRGLLTSGDTMMKQNL